MSKLFFSWDDGHPDDFRIKDLFEKYEIPCMLFIPHSNPENIVVTTKEIIKLRSKLIEIGAHTYNHQFLTKIDMKKVDNELQHGKSFLEDCLGESIDHFCLPGGCYNNEIIYKSILLFKTVRTAKTGCTHWNLPLIDPTFHFYPRGIRSLLYNSFLNDKNLFYTILSNGFKYEYFDLIKLAITYLVNNKNTKILIWGHSWEISKLGLWSQLEDFLRFIHDNHKKNCAEYSSVIFELN